MFGNILISIYVFISIINIQFLNAENLGYCFGTGDSCKNNRATIFGEYYGCQVLKRFSTLPTRVVYMNGQIYIKMYNGVYVYDKETSEFMSVNIKLPGRFKTIEFDGRTFIGGIGKGVVNIDGEDEEYVVYTEDDAVFDQFELYKDKIFILSHKLKAEKRDTVGALYTLNTEDMKFIDESTISAQVVEDINDKFTSMAVDLENDKLLLVGQDGDGGKLLSLSLIPHNPCTISKELMVNRKDESIEIIRETSKNLTNLLENFTPVENSYDSQLINNITVLKKKLEHAERLLSVSENKINHFRSGCIFTTTNRPTTPLPPWLHTTTIPSPLPSFPFLGKKQENLDIRKFEGKENKDIDDLKRMLSTLIDDMESLKLNVSKIQNYLFEPEDLF